MGCDESEDARTNSLLCTDITNNKSWNDPQGCLHVPYDDFLAACSPSKHTHTHNTAQHTLANTTQTHTHKSASTYTLYTCTHAQISTCYFFKYIYFSMSCWNQVGWQSPLKNYSLCLLLKTIWSMLSVWRETLLWADNLDSTCNEKCMHSESAPEVWGAIHGQLPAPESHRGPDVGHLRPHCFWRHNLFCPARCFEGQ